MIGTVVRVRMLAAAALIGLVLSACTGDTPSEEAPTVTYGAALEQGKRYAYELGLHCGMEFLGQFDGRGWQLTEASAGVTPETGAGDPLPDDWPTSGDRVLGFVTVVDAERLEYSLPDGTVIGIYEPIPAQDVPGCD